MATEEPKFASVLREGDLELREYPELVVAEVSVGGDHDQAASAGFRLLAGYIFGGNTRHQLKAAGSAALARYIPPWTLWFMRRNEVMIPVSE